MHPSLRYFAAACQTDLPNPADRSAFPGRVTKLLAMIDRAVVGYAPVLRREAGRLPRVRPRRADLRDRRGAARQAGGADPERAHRPLLAEGEGATASTSRPARSWKSTRQYPGCVFNTTCLIGPDGLLDRYRKVNPWLPWEVHASPHDLPGYAEPMFPVVETEIGRLGVAICYDWLFPEAIRAAGAAAGPRC